MFDPTHKTLLADKGEIRVGSRYQAEPPSLLKEGQSHQLMLIITVPYYTHVHCFSSSQVAEIGEIVVLQVCFLSPFFQTPDVQSCSLFK